MSRISDIIRQARVTLADKDADRWSDDRLIQLIDEAQKDIIKQTKYLKGEFSLSPQVGVNKYKLPDDVWFLTRVTFDSCPIPFLSYNDFDRSEFVDRLDYDWSSHYSERVSGPSYPTDCWEEDTGGEVCAILYDKRAISEITIYPIPNDSIVLDGYPFDNAQEPQFEGDEVLGVVTAIDGYTFNSTQGVVTNIFDPAQNEGDFNSIYGVVTSIAETKGLVKFWYIRLPKTVTAITDTLETPALFDTAIRYYVIAHAFLDDLDTRFVERSDKFLNFYLREITIADETSSTDGVKNAGINRTPYRTGFE